jgi:predicted TIM-barrel fold metal-dependent hydrolase
MTGAKVNSTLPIWDIHCHLPGFSGRTPAQKMDTLLSYADRMGIERVCVSMGLKLTTHPTADELRRQNDEVLAAIVRHHDRAFGLCYASGELPVASVAEIDRCIRDGPMVGVKLWVARRASEFSLDPIIARASIYHAPIMQHTWFKTDGTQQADESTPFDVVALASRNPHARLICGHSGGTWESGIRAVRESQTVVIEIAGSDPTTGFVEMAVRELGPERIVFGSDAGGRSFASQLAKVIGADVPEDVKRLILAGNLKRLLGPILESKGFRVE